jgi:DNA polymerase-1
MQTIKFGSKDSIPEIAILIKSTGMNATKLKNAYIIPSGFTLDKFMAWELVYETQKKCPAKLAKEHILDLLPDIEYYGIKTLLVADGTYFKYLTGIQKIDPYYGAVVPCSVKEFTNMNVVLIPNFQALIYNPMIQGKMDRSLDTLVKFVSGESISEKKDILHSARYPESPYDIQIALNNLHQYDHLSCDTETRGLEFWNCGLSTIGFAWDKHNGIAFGIERGHEENVLWRPKEKSDEIKRMLKEFFINYKGNLVFHNANYDMKVLVYELWMKEI